MNITLEKKIIEIPATVVHKEKDIRKRELRVAAYCRVSTDSEEQLNSYKSQIEYYTSIIEENPRWRLAGIFADEGLSATSTKKREQFNRMIQKCRRGSIDLIITKSVSRFARNTLDCIGYVRKLKEMNVGVLFEKEGVNTLEMDDETLLTIFGVLAQTESQSLSKNVAMGFRQSFKAGKVFFQYKNILGYRKGADGEPEIDEDEAKIIRRIYHRYLAGESIGQIRKALVADGILTPHGKTDWSEALVQRILRNERYVGDALLQKTYIKDVISRKVEKNNGELPQYYIQNNHPAIIDRDIWNKVQEEAARRTAKRKSPSKTAHTGSSKYSSKYALNEILVCGECGTPYRHIMWTKPEGKVAVWRCISRLEHGKKHCKESPTMPEEVLHAAIMNAISEAILRDALVAAITDSVKAAACAESDAAGYQAARRRIGELDGMTSRLIAQSALTGDDESFYDEKLKEVFDERSKWSKIVRDFEANDSLDRYTERQVTDAISMLEHEPLLLSQYDDQIVRQLVDTICIEAKDKITVILKGGTEIIQYIEV